MARGFTCSNCSHFIIIRFLSAGQVAKCLNCQSDQVVPSRLEEFDEDVPTHPAFKSADAESRISSYGFSEPVITDSGFTHGEFLKPRVTRQISNPWLQFWSSPRDVIRWAIDGDHFREAVILSMIGTAFGWVEGFSTFGWLNAENGLSYLRIIAALMGGAIVGLGMILVNAFVEKRVAKVMYEKDYSERSFIIASSWSSLPSMLTAFFTLVGVLFFAETFMYWPEQLNSRQETTNFWTSLSTPIAYIAGIWIFFTKLVAISELLGIRKRQAFFFMIVVGLIVGIPIMPVVYLFTSGAFVPK